MRLIPCKFTLIAATAGIALLQSGCNATSSDGSNDSTTQSATGVWSGSDSVSGAGVTAIINSTGQAAFIRSDGVLFTGTAQVSGGNLAVAVDGYPQFPSAFSDGSDYGIGTLNGTVTTGASVAMSWVRNADTLPCSVAIAT